MDAVSESGAENSDLSGVSYGNNTIIFQFICFLHNETDEIVTLKH